MAGSENLAAPRDLVVDKLAGPRWLTALDLLRTGGGTVLLRGLRLRTEYLSPRTRQLHVEFGCPFDPALLGRAPSEHLIAAVTRALDAARRFVAQVGAKDARFADLASPANTFFDCVHRYGAHVSVIATAGTWGDPAWRWGQPGQTAQTPA